MAVEKDLELLDEYLTNRLSGEERSAFEKKLETDAALKSEYNLQRQLVEGIKKARIAQLKTIMSNTPIPPVNGFETAMLAKVGIGIFVTAVVGTGIYLYSHKEPKENIVSQAQTAIVTEKAKEVEPRVEVPTTEALPQQQQPSEQKSSSEKATNKKDESVKTQHTAKPLDTAAATPSGRATQPKIDVFDPSTETETQSSKNGVPKTDSKASAKEEAHAPSIVVETDASNSKYNFHYQFKKSKLMLYGSFEKNLYEIMEFFTDNKRTIFLFYKSNYYLLNDENERIKPLTPISDPVLLKKLKEYHGN